MSSKDLRNHTNTYSKRGIKSNVNVMGGMLNMAENCDRPTEAWASGPKCEAGDYDDSKHRGGAIFEKSGVYAKATTGRAEANSWIFGAYAEGPCAGAGAEMRQLRDDFSEWSTEDRLDREPTCLTELSASTELSLAKAGVEAGPVSLELNPNLNTGASVAFCGIIPVKASANFLGFGVGVGAENYIATPLGKIKLSLWCCRQDDQTSLRQVVTSYDHLRQQGLQTQHKSDCFLQVMIVGKEYRLIGCTGSTGDVERESLQMGLQRVASKGEGMCLHRRLILRGNRRRPCLASGLLL